MEIIANHKDPHGKYLGRAIGFGDTSHEAIKAVLHCAQDLAALEDLSALRERLNDLIAAWQPNAYSADFDDPGWAVSVYW